jgi:Response regulator containing CheY-like receiver, AAA-type ATPase, and DNA-binding domains
LVPTMSRILLIDDDEAVREATEMLLDAKGFDVVAVEDGTAGIEAVRNGSFDAAIVDLFMPGMDGLQTTRALHEHDPRLAVIAVSGFMMGDRFLEMPNFDTMAAEAGAFVTLYKPFRTDALLQAIDTALNGPTPISRSLAS